MLDSLQTERIIKHEQPPVDSESIFEEFTVWWINVATVYEARRLKRFLMRALIFHVGISRGWNAIGKCWSAKNLETYLDKLSTIIKTSLEQRSFQSSTSNKSKNKSIICCVLQQVNRFANICSKTVRFLSLNIADNDEPRRNLCQRRRKNASRTTLLCSKTKTIIYFMAWKLQ